MSYEGLSEARSQQQAQEIVLVNFVDSLAHDQLGNVIKEERHSNIQISLFKENVVALFLFYCLIDMYYLYNKFVVYLSRVILNKYKHVLTIHITDAR